MSRTLDISLLREAVEYLIAWGLETPKQTVDQIKLLRRASLAAKAVSDLDSAQDDGD
jgi:hypothetical protein